MTQQEHLQLIRAKCVELLELAKQRTPGAWQAALRLESHYIIANDDICGGCYIASVTGHSWGAIGSKEGTANAAFIASAAGPFEAALASTVAAIDDSMWQPAPEGYCHPDNPWGVENTALIQQIIASWPLELLQQK